MNKWNWEWTASAKDQNKISSATSGIAVHRPNIDITFDLKYKCNQCDSRFGHWRTLMNHIKHKHPKKLYPCPFCDKEFEKIDVLSRHIEKNHDNVKDFMCPYCGRKRQTMYGLRQHVACNHRKKLNNFDHIRTHIEKRQLLLDT